MAPIRPDANLHLTGDITFSSGLLSQLETPSDGIYLFYAPSPHIIGNHCTNRLAGATQRYGITVDTASGTILQHANDVIGNASGDVVNYVSAPVEESRVRIGQVFLITGTGSPASVVTAPVGSLFLRTDGGTSTSLYVKESGTGNTGWVAK